MSHRYTILDEGQAFEVEIERRSAEAAELRFSKQPVAAQDGASADPIVHTHQVDGLPTEQGSWSLLIDGHSYEVMVDVDPNTPDQLEVSVRGERHTMEVLDERRLRMRAGSAGFGAEGRLEIRAPMPGKVIEVLVAVDEDLVEGQGLIVVEAMKMENELRTPRAGRVVELRVEAGQTVDGGAVLAVIE